MMLNGVLSDSRLENGLHLLCHSVPGSPLGVVTLLYRVGSRYEAPGERGYAHLFEHLMFDGSRTLERGEYDRYCTMAGGENNAWTSTDLTSYWLALPSEALELGLWLEADRMAGFGVEADALQTQLSVIEAERRQVIDNVPYGIAGEELRRLLYAPSHPYYHEPIGLREDLQGASVEKLRSFFDRYYHPGNATLVIAGDMRTAEMISLAEEHFGEIPARTTPSSPVARSEDLLIGQSADIHSDITPLNALFLGWHAPEVRHNDIKALDLLSMILADGGSSRLAVALEYDRKIVSECGAWVEDGEIGSVFHLYGIVRENSVSPEDLAAEMRSLLSRLVSNGIAPEELQKARNRKGAGLISGLSSISHRAERLAWFGTTFDDPGLLWNEAKEYEQITPEEILDVARRLLVNVEPTQLNFHAPGR